LRVFSDEGTKFLSQTHALWSVWTKNNLDIADIIDISAKVIRVTALLKRQLNRSISSHKRYKTINKQMIDETTTRSSLTDKTSNRHWKIAPSIEWQRHTYKVKYIVYFLLYETIHVRYILIWYQSCKTLKGLEVEPRVQRTSPHCHLSYRIESFSNQTPSAVLINEVNGR
jgi:hypothetical protein